MTSLYVYIDGLVQDHSISSATRLIQNFAIPGCFSCILFTIFSPYFLQVGLLLQHVAPFQSGH